MYNNPTFTIKNNGWLTRPCKMNRGIRQGCPVSALIFNLVVEIMASKIRQNNAIHGVPIPTTYGYKECKSTQYADDTTLTVVGKHSITAAIKEVNNFGKVSGMKLNIEINRRKNFRKS